MLKPVAFANAVTVVTICFYILYLIFIAVFPELIYIYNSSMTPGYNLSPLETGGKINFGFAILGGVLMAITVWVFIYVMIWFYNRLAK